MTATVRARSRSLAAAGAAVLALVTLVVAVLVVLPWLEVRGLEQQDVALPAPAAPAVPTTQAPTADPVPEPSPDPARGVPVRVEIDAIGVDAVVEPVDMGAGANLVPPADVARVGWWQGGARPGSARGSVVLAGHSVRLGHGVFDDLGELRPGDEVRVHTRRGVVTYAVDGVREYTFTQVARLAPALFGRDVQSRLALVTCSGYYGGQYHANTVVLASPTRGT